MRFRLESARQAVVHEHRLLTRSIIVLHPVLHVGGVMFLRGSRQFEVGTIGEMELFSASSDQIG